MVYRARRAVRGGWCKAGANLSFDRGACELYASRRVPIERLVVWRTVSPERCVARADMSILPKRVGGRIGRREGVAERVVARSRKTVCNTTRWQRRVGASLKGSESFKPWLIPFVNCFGAVMKSLIAVSAWPNALTMVCDVCSCWRSDVICLGIRLLIDDCTPVVNASISCNHDG